MGSLLYSRECPINEHIKIVIPTVGEILAQEDDYYGLVSVLTAMPIDLMVQLDDIGIDFSKLDDYELFLLMFEGLRERDTSLIFGDLDLSKFAFAFNEKSQMAVVYNEETGAMIDKEIHRKIAVTLRTIHGLTKNNTKPGNEEARKFLIERARKKASRKKNTQTESQLETLILSLVNTEQFKYDFESVKNLTIYQFNACVQQIVKKIEYDNRMIGVYTGNIDTKEMRQDDFVWLYTDKK